MLVDSISRTRRSTSGFLGKKAILPPCGRQDTLIARIEKSFSSREKEMRRQRFHLQFSLFFCRELKHLRKKRVALIIGNGSYVNQSKLDNPPRDAQVIGATLGRAWDSGLSEIAPLLISIRPRWTGQLIFLELWPKMLILLYFTFPDTGYRSGGTNYLVPTDLGYYSASNVDFRTLNANLILKILDQSRARLKMVLLDACRTNPFIPRKDQSGGLAYMQAPAGTVIGFATQPNTTATQGPAGGISPTPGR